MRDDSAREKIDPGAGKIYYSELFFSSKSRVEDDLYLVLCFLSSIMLSLVLCFLSYYAFCSIMLSLVLRILVLCFLSYYAFSRIMLSLVLCFLSYYAFSIIMLSLVLCFLSYYAFFQIIFYATLRVQYCHRDKHHNINLTYLYYTTLLGYCKEQYSSFNTVGKNILADRVLSKKI